MKAFKLEHVLEKCARDLLVGVVVLDTVSTFPAVCCYLICFVVYHTCPFILLLPKLSI